MEDARLDAGLPERGLTGPRDRPPGGAAIASAMRPAMARCAAAGVALLLCAAALCEEKAGTAPPVPTTAPAARPAATTRPDSEAARPADAEDLTFPPPLLAAARNSFVVVSFWYKKDEREPAGAAETNWQAQHLYDSYVDKKRPEERVGIVLDDRGHVLVSDDGVEDRFIDRIEVAGTCGAKLPATREKLLHDAPAIVLEVEGADAERLRGLEFAGLAGADENTVLKQAVLHRTDDHWRIHVSTLHPTVRFAPGQPKNVYYGYRFSSQYSYGGYRGTPTIIADQRGRPVGCSLTGFMDLLQLECTWKGASLLEADGISWKELRAAEKEVRAALIAATHEVVVRFREGEGDLSEPGRYERYRPYRPHREGGAAGRETTAYGIAISPRRILVPSPMERETAAQIDRIQLKLPSGRRASARFVGAYKGFAAFLIEAPGGKLKHVRPASADLPRMRPFWVARARKKFGAKYVDLERNRLFGKGRGYAGQYHWYAFRRIRPGSFLVNVKGELAGLFVPYRTEDEEQRSLERSGRYGRSESEPRVFLISEIRAALSGPAEHMDPKIKVKPRTQAKRRAWLGVEFVGMNDDLAEEFKAEKPTSDGRLGFLINAVYRRSPAERLGLKVGDILLKIHPPGRRQPIDLLSERAEDDDYRSRWYGGYSENDALGPLPPSWKSRRNALTWALDAIGVGNEVKITYYRPAGQAEAKTVTVGYKIELAPPDFDSARRWRNRKLGLTAKNLTYEVRHALNLKESDPGVIVAKVEPGSPVRTAKLYAHEVVTRLDDTPIRSVRQLRDGIAAAKMARRKKVRLTVLRLGKTRFTDLVVATYDPQEDEGLDKNG
jgi:hypothetical protein